MSIEIFFLEFPGTKTERSRRYRFIHSSFVVAIVVYLIFNEGYSAERPGTELSREAIRLDRLLLDLLQLHRIQEPEVMGLVGLMLLQESRRAARTSPDGDLILLEQQDRSLWNRKQIAEGIALTESALQSRAFGAYTLQAAIAAVHAGSSSVASTEWHEITLLYDRLLRIQPSPVVELNRAVAVDMCEGLEKVLCLIDDLRQRSRVRVSSSPPYSRSADRVVLWLALVGLPCFAFAIRTR